MIVQGLLVHGANHFVVDGRRPSFAEARALATRWEMPVIGFVASPDDPLSAWSIRTRAFRENLSWAIVLRGAEPHSHAVSNLLSELAARGVEVEHEPLQ